MVKRTKEFKINKRKRTTRENRGEFRQKEERLAKDFLRERNLLTTFNRFKRLKGIKKKTIMTEQDGISQRLVIHKRGKRLIIRDAFSLRVLATTKRFNFKNILNAFSQKKETSYVLSIPHKGKKRDGFIKKNILKLKELTRIPLTNVVQVDRLTPLRKKIGKLFINVTFISKSKLGLPAERITVEGGSRKLRLLNVEGQREIAFNQAFQGALSNPAITFSYDTFIINWIHFSYYIAKKKPQPIFQFENVLKAV